MVTNQEGVEGEQPVQSHSHVQQPLQPQTCVYRSMVLVKQDPLRQFSSVHEMSLVLLFKVLNYLSSVGLSGRKQCTYIVSGKVEFNACQASLLWHNFFLVSL